MTRRNISNEATVRKLIGLSPRSMHATVLTCMPSASATADCVKPSDSRKARRSAGRIAKDVGDTKCGHQLRELRVCRRVVAVTGQHTGNDARRSFPCGRPSGSSFVSGYGAAVQRDNHVQDSVLRCDSKVLSPWDSVKGQFSGANKTAFLGVATTAQGDA